MTPNVEAAPGYDLTGLVITFDRSNRKKASNERKRLATFVNGLCAYYPWERAVSVPMYMVRIYYDC